MPWNTPNWPQFSRAAILSTALVSRYQPKGQVGHFRVVASTFRIAGIRFVVAPGAVRISAVCPTLPNKTEFTAAPTRLGVRYSVILTLDGPMNPTFNSPLKGKPLRNPGQSLDLEIDELLNDKILGSLLLPAGFWVFALIQWYLESMHAKNMAIWFACTAVLFSIWSAVRFTGLRRRLRALRLGRDGERAVGQFLEDLRKHGAQVFHDIPGDKFNLDHVVISGHGVFVVETKTRSKPTPDARVTLNNGELRLAGYRPERDPIRQVQAQISWLTDTLEESTGKRFPVRGALVFPGWYVAPELKNAFDKIWVISPRALPAFIAQEPVCLEPSDVSLATSHLSRFIRSSTS
jgi:hypothetical protein